MTNSRSNSKPTKSLYKKCPNCLEIKSKSEFVNFQGKKNPRGKYCQSCYKKRILEAKVKQFDGLLSREIEYIEKYKIIYGDNWQSRASIDSLSLFLFMERDYCPYCGKSFREYQENKDYNQCREIFHIDHLNPLKLGGEDSIRNAVCVCKKCNLKKGSLSFLSWLDKLKPKYREISRSIYIEQIGYPPEEFVESESLSDIRAYGLIYLLVLSKEELLKMKENGDLYSCENQL